MLEWQTDTTISASIGTGEYDAAGVYGIVFWDVDSVYVGLNEYPHDIYLSHVDFQIIYGIVEKLKRNK